MGAYAIFKNMPAFAFRVFTGHIRIDLKIYGFRGGGGYGKEWHRDGARTKKMNSIYDFVSCGEFLLEKGIIQENKLAGWGYSAGGLLVASAINTRPDLFRAAVLKVCMIYF